MKRNKRTYDQDSFSTMREQIRWMLPYTKKYWFAIVFYSVIGVAGTVMGLAASVMTKILIDIVTGTRTGGIAAVAAAMVGMGCGSILINAITSRISTHLSTKVQNEIQADVYDKIMEADWEELHDYRSGDLLNRLNGDVYTVAGSVIGWIPGLITKSARFFGALLIILYYDATMALIALISAPVSMFVSRFLLRKMRTFNREIREASSDLMSFQEDSFQNIQSVKAFGIADRFKENLRLLQSRYKKITMDYNKVTIITTAIMSFVGMMTAYLCLGWGIYRLWSGAIVFGTLALFLQLSANLSSSFSSLVSLVPQAISAATCAGRIMAVVLLPKERLTPVPEIEKFKEFAAEGGLEVCVESVDFSYKDGKKVLAGACMRAKPGAVAALTGPSGEGKTTLIRILLGLINPVSGKVYLRAKNKETCEITGATRWAFSYVPQGNTIFAGTVAENLRMVKPEATDDEIIKALNTACALDFVMKLPDGINTVLRERGKGLSEGQAQRISIARALLRDAPVLLLDEATSALDTDTERRLIENILNENSLRTCVVTTHRPGVLKMCRDIYRIDGTVMTKISREDAEM